MIIKPKEGTDANKDGVITAEEYAAQGDPPVSERWELLAASATRATYRQLTA